MNDEGRIMNHELIRVLVGNTWATQTPEAAFKVVGEPEGHSSGSHVSIAFRHEDN